MPACAVLNAFSALSGLHATIGEKPILQKLVLPGQKENKRGESGVLGRRWELSRSLTREVIAGNSASLCAPASSEPASLPANGIKNQTARGCCWYRMEGKWETQE